MEGEKSSKKFARTVEAVDNDVDVDFSMSPQTYHVPVMLDECCSYLMTVSNGLYIDGTLGGGGHTKEILERGGRVIGLDQDPDAIKETSAKLSKFIESDRLEIIQRNFRFISSALKDSRLADGNLADGILLDLGVSSFQINNASRGFAFGADGPLDMRMGRPLDGSTTGASVQTGLTAATIINTWDATAIANLLYELGEEPRSRALAREIVANRPLNTTKALADVISRITFFKHRTKTLARCFQALRIAVNDEMRALDDTLNAVQSCLKPGGRLVVLSYHSLEDRRVKRLMRTGSAHGEGEDGSAKTVMDSYHVEGRGGPPSSPWRLLFKGTLAPQQEEITRNRRARSAKLRVAELLDVQSLSSKELELARGRPAKYSSGVLGAKQRQKLSKNRLDEDGV